MDEFTQGAEIRLLGPVGIWREGRRLGPATAQQRTVLAVLVLEGGRVVSLDKLVTALWESAPPARARNAVQGCVSRIRRVLRAGLSGAGAELATVGQGYRLAIDRSAVDLDQFRDTVRLARLRPPAEAHAMLRSGLARWRGPALSDVAGSWLADRVLPSLEEERLSALEQRIGLDLLLDRQHEVLEELAALITEFPLRERLVCLRVIALCRCGRRADASTLIRRWRARFVDELGIDPGPEFEDLHRAVLAGEEPALPPTGFGGAAGERLPPSRAATAVALATPVGIRQLPAFTPHFAGRIEELNGLDTDGGGIRLISGTAGVGKSTLALRWAQRAAERFPDGQIHLDMRGFNPNSPPADATETLPAMLHILQVPAERIPASLDAQIALYRSMLVDRRMIIVLDNARHADQVRPLLPGSPGHAVVITSRNELASLIVREGARSLPLTVLSADEAREMLRHRIGADRVAAEPGAVDGIIARCAGLPLALAIVAARAAVRPEFRLDSLVRVGDGLDAFDGGDPSTQVRAVFSWSYRTLSTGAARMFRLLGLHPGPDITAAAAAGLAGTPAPLAELAGGHLVSEHVAGRYLVHDLLRDYAAELALTQDEPGERRAATHRMFDHYLHSSYEAQRLLVPHTQAVTPAPPVAGVEPERPAGAAEALAWFDAERLVLAAVIAQAARSGFATHAWQLAWTLTEHVVRRGYWHDWVKINHVVLAALNGGPDLVGRAYTHRGLAVGYARLDRYDEAYRHFEQGLELFRRDGDPAGQGEVRIGLAWVRGSQGRYADALHQAGLALTLFRQAGSEPGQAGALNALGWYHAQAGDHRAALIHCEQAIPLQQKAGDRRGEASTWDSLGVAHHHLGDRVTAAACCRKAVELYRQCGARYNEAEALIHLGDARAPDDPPAARDAWRRGLAILDELGHRDAELIRAKLGALEAGS